nr:reverse transcriptase domain-containing protein [Tanacetum cinerariifolium]
RNFKNWQTHHLMKIAQRLSLRSYPKNLETLLIPCCYHKLKYKALADLGASINLIPLSVWKKLGLPELISTRVTLELANQAIFTPAGIARDVFNSVGKFTFPADFVSVDYESDPRVPLTLGRPFLRTARALIDVHGKEMILRDGDDRLTLNMRHDTSSYSHQPQKESINLINVFNNLSKYFLKDLFSTNKPSGSGSLLSNTVANPKGELKAITTRRGLVLDEPTVPTPSSFINPEVDERVEETLTDQDLSEYTIKVPPPPVQKYKPPSQRDYVMYQRDPLHPSIPYPSRMLKKK